MNHDADLRRRIEELEQLLLQDEPWFLDNTGDDAHAVNARIARALERLRQLTTAMQHRRADDDDPLDRVTMRLMLEDYTLVLSHLRASVRTADQLLSSVAKTVTDGHRIVRREASRRRR